MTPTPVRTFIVAAITTTLLLGGAPMTRWPGII